MDNRYYDGVIKEMQPFFDEHGFKENEDGSFSGDTHSVKIEYSEEKQMYILLLSEKEDGKFGEYAQISSWLFDDTQYAKDAEAVGVDFTATLREKLGIKLKRAPVTDVDLPSAQKSGALTVAGYTKKVLDVFPQYKEDYKAHIAHYGNFLYMEFYSKTLIPQIRAILAENSKKTVKKLYELLEVGYIKGDKDTVNLVVASIAAAICIDESIKDAALAMLDADSHFKSSVTSFIPVMSSDKKLRAAFIK